MLNPIQKYKLIIIVILIIASILIIAAFNYLNKGAAGTRDTNDQFNPTLIGNNKTFNESSQQAFKDSAEFLKKDSKVSLMLRDTPYNGTNFKIAYNYNKFKVEVIFNKSNRDAAEKEFSDFLNKYEIGDRSWIRNLEIREE